MLKAIPKLFVNRVSHLEKWLSAAGGIISLLGILYISQALLGKGEANVLVASMGASAVLLFAVPHGLLSQPWAVFGGHCVSALIGVTCAKFIPDQTVAAAVAVGLAIGAMNYLNCLHPPGGATALSAVVGSETIHQLGYWFVLTPVLLNVVIILFIAVVFNYPLSWRRYPLSIKPQRY